ncbi:MAG TPA: cache domain-containing protein, partial [Bacillota bacterium]|nr:cache domain-containing protein [Bacillota bacterium]
MQLSYRMKLAFILMLTVFITASAMGFYGVESSKKEYTRFAEEKLLSDAGMSNSLIDSKYPGAWKVANGILYKGNKAISNNFALVDSISKITGDTVTIFLGDKRVATTLLKADGTRAVNTKADPVVVQKV